VQEGKTELNPVPERRPLEKQAKAYEAPTSVTKIKAETAILNSGTITETPKNKPKLWYCKQCGYVVFRDDPPYICPICKAKKEMFAEIKTRINFTG
jgi:ferredoxin-thioredoxin reductase catalytic chain